MLVKPKSFAEIASSIKPKKSITKACSEHQAMMERVIKAGFATTKRTESMWAGWIKYSAINDIDLERTISKAQSLVGYSPRGFVRNRLQNRDWYKFFD